MHKLHRRHLLQRGSIALAGLAFSKNLFAGIEKEEWFAGDPDVAKQVRIGFNENPYGPSAAAQKAMMEAIGGSNRYGDGMASSMISKLAAYHQVGEANLLLGAGSTEMLGITAALASSKGKNAVVGDPTFGSWFHTAETFGMSLKKVPLTQEKVHDLPKMLAAIDKQTSLVYVVNPHNPTGTIVDSKTLADFINEASKKCMVLLDEAYNEFSDEPTFIPMVKENRNLVVAKTFSKIHGLAGARIGYVIAHTETIKQFSNYQPWPNINASRVSLAGAMASLADDNFVKECKRKNNEVKKMVSDALNNMGMPVIPSHTNFIYYNASAFKGDLTAVMKSNNIVGVWNIEQGTGWRRTSIGTMDEMQQFLKVIKGA